ncbi:MAG: metal-dependent transcriptional regulator [Verrucomicrobia bacterium]|nr:metal-dependent transcriptional regulator [Verrucomicrobiota bacterium]
MISNAVENFLKSIYELRHGEEWVSTSALAERLDHRPASVTNMIQKVADSDMDLIEYMPYRGVRLKPNGEMIALEVVRHHRLIELYLTKALGVPWDKVHDEAEKLEHVISEDLEDRMAKALGNPTVDPHGHPIPSKSLKVRKLSSQPLSGVAVGTTVEVVQVNDHDPSLLRYLGDMGLYPSTRFTVVNKEAFGNSLHIKIGDKEHSLGEEATRYISVAVVEKEAI